MGNICIKTVFAFNQFAYKRIALYKKVVWKITFLGGKKLYGTHPFISCISTPVEIFLCDLLKPSMRFLNIQKVLVPFTDGELKEHGQNLLNSLNVVKETP